MKNTFATLIPVFLLFQFSLPAAAQIPNIIGHQGKIVVNSTNFDGAGSFKFALVSDTGSIYWENSPDSNGDGQPDEAVSLTVRDGLYSVLLGDTTLSNMATIPYSVFAYSDVRLRVWFSDSTHGWEQLSPDQRVAPSGYAFQAALLNGEVSSNADGYLMVSGRAGIGTTSPEYKLDVNLSGHSRTYMHETTGSSSSKIYNLLTLDTNNAEGCRNYLKFNHNNTTQTQIYSNYDSGSSVATLTLETAKSADIRFKTNGDNLCMVVKSSGKVGIGTDSPTTQLEVDQVITCENVIYTSDRRFKENIGSIANALAIIKNIRGVYFDWNRRLKPNSNSARQVGFIGQEVEQHLPEVVKTGAQGQKYVAYQNLTPVLVEAMKEQQTLIDRQQGEIDLLKEKITRLEKLLEGSHL